MNIKSFSLPDEVNEFVKTVKLDHIEAFENKYVVFYRPYLTAEEVRAQKILEDENEAWTNLTQAEMHLDYLEAALEDGNEKVQSGIDNTKENMANDRAKLVAVNKWKDV